MAAPNTFSDKTGQIALTLLDENFEYVDTSLSSLQTTLQNNIDSVQSNLDNIDLTDIQGNTTITGTLNVTSSITGSINATNLVGAITIESNGAINYGNTALIASTANVDAATSTNVDHIWHDDSPSALGNGGTWHFCSDTSYRNTGNSTIRCASIDVDRISSSCLQVVHKVYTGKTTYSVPTAGQTGTYIAALDTTITPTRSANKIRVEFNMSFEVHHDTVLRLFRVINGATTEVVRNGDGNYWSGFAYPGYDADNGSTPRTNHYIYIDSPNTTSAITYRLMIQSGGIGATTFYLNRPINSTGAANYENAISQCILTEIPQ